MHIRKMTKYKENAVDFDLDVVVTIDFSQNIKVILKILCT